MDRRIGAGVLGLAALVGAAVAPQWLPARADESSRPHAGDAERGARVYARTCAACHGRSGEGDGPGAADLDPLPRNFTAGQFRFRTTPSGRLPRPEDIDRTIRRGLPGTAMPAFGEVLSAREIADLTTYVIPLAPVTMVPGSPVDAVAIPAVPAPSAASIAEGRNLYRIMECWSCHGIDGSGKGQSADGLLDEVGDPILPTDFRFAPLKGGREPEAVVRTLLTGLNGTPMPAYGEAMLFAREDVENLSSYEGRLPKTAIDEMGAFIKTIPGSADIAAMDDEKKLALRDRRLAALSHYVLSLRRHGLGPWLLREHPEKEARR
jgi:mono/diheme cytochrome c family protein